MQKNQNDLIFSIVFGVLGLIAVGVAYATKPEVPSIPAPPVIVTKAAELPATSVVYGDALPGGSTASGGGMGGPGGMSGRGMGAPGGFGAPGRGGPPGGFGGPSGGMSVQGSSGAMRGG